MWRLPFVCLTGMNITDFWATAILIQRDGYSQETNPLLIYLMVMCPSIWTILVVKFFWLAILGFMLVYFGERLTHRLKLIRNALWGLAAGLALTTTLGILMLYGIHI